MKRSILKYVLCLLLVLALPVMQGCTDDADGGSTPGSSTGNFEPWNDSMGTTQTITKDDGSKTLERYDHSGRLVRTEHIATDGKTLNFYCVFEYDTDGKLVREAKYGKKNDLWESCEYKYENGKLTNKQIMNSKGVITDEYFYNAEGEERYHCSYDYDEKGQLTEICYLGPDNLGLGYVWNTYDDSGKIIRREELTSYQVVIRTLDYNDDGTYDETKHIKLDTGILYDSRKLVTRYDANNKKLYAHRYKGEELDAYTVYNNDGSGTTQFYYLKADLYATYVTNIKYEYIFDKDEQFVKETGYRFDDGTVSYIREGIFDDSGKLTGKFERGYWRSGALGSETTYTADDRILLYKEFSEDGSLSLWFTGKYDDENRTARWDYYYGDELSYYRIETYYEDGSIKSIREYDSTGYPNLSEDYDQQGNLIYPE